MIKKVLIANRGEIAVRIIRACAEMNIRSVAIYTDADRFSLHVKRADEAYYMGDDPFTGYMNAHNLVNLARETGCEALHPGYGFLSENPVLADICAKSGIVFIGPKAITMQEMGDKISARKKMIAAGIPVTPGSNTSLKDLNEAISIANKIGYPVMLKATNGGGGRGIRRCSNEQELKKNYSRVISEVTKAFGNPDIFLEKCINNPLHIEVQILADSLGNVVHLYERDCSIQRRNQKLIEVTPSPQLSGQQKDNLHSLAVSAAKAVNYINAGTVEFLVTPTEEVYFMEMNTRLQVEHTISEEITGVDIVCEQLKIASGLPLTFKQEDIKKNGYAMQLRINAEDPKNNFLPNFGEITRYYAPGGPGVRTDTAIYTGYVIPPFFDSMCLKLIVRSLSWESLINRAIRALNDMRLQGIKTTATFYTQVLNSKSFRQANFDTSFIEKHPEFLNYSQKCSPADQVLAIAAAIVAHADL